MHSTFAYCMVRSLIFVASNLDVLRILIKKAPSNEPPVLTKSMNIKITLNGTSNQLFTRGF